MNVEEFSNQFDVHYNNITSNQAPGLTEYEKSVFLTKAQNEIVKNYFTANSKGNNIGQGFDDSANRQADFSCLMKTAECSSISSSSTSTGICGYIIKQTGVWFYLSASKTTGGDITSTLSTYITFPAGKSASSVINGEYTAIKDSTGKYVILKDGTGEYRATVTNSFPDPIASSISKIDSRSALFVFPEDVFISINETAMVGSKNLQVVPLRYDEYLRLMSKPYKRPLKWQAWRLINTGESSSSVNTATKYVELIGGPNDVIDTYSIRYLRYPKPIILSDLDGLTISGVGTETECELDPVIHEDILQRAVELAKIAWTANGQDNLQPVITAGQRSE